MKRLRPVLAIVGRLAPELVVVLCVLCMFVAVHTTFFSPAVTMNAKDEGYINASSLRMLYGHFLPYVDAVSHRGPMLYVVAAAASGLGDRWTFVPIRVLALLCSMLTVVLVFVAAARAKRPLAGALAAIGVLVACVLEMPADDGLAYNGEVLLNVFALGALLALTCGLAGDREAPSPRWTAAAGALAALGALTKQVGAVTVVALAIWPLAASLSRPGTGSRLRRWSPLWAFALGAFVPVAVVVLRYAASGALGTLYFYAVTYNSRYYMAPLSGGEAIHRYREWLSDHATIVVVGVATSALVMGRALLARARGRGLWQTIDEEGFVLSVAVCALLSGAVANATARGFPHYFVQAVPWFALLLGLVLEEGLVPAGASTARRVLTHASVLALPLAVVVCLYVPKVAFYREQHAKHLATLPICEYVTSHTGADDPIYVWGFAADIYTYYHRRPASRFVYSTFQSGYVPFFDTATPEQDRARVVPGSPDQFVDDLESTRAALVIDVPFTLGQRKIDDTPQYAAYLARQYCSPLLVAGVRVFPRRAPDGSCPVR